MEGHVILVNPYSPGSKEFKKWEAQKAITAMQRVQENAKANVSEAQDIRFGKSQGYIDRLQSAQGQRSLLGGTAQELRYAAEGGPMMLEEPMMPEGELSLLAPEEVMGMEDPMMGSESPTDLTALLDVLGEEGFSQLEQAMADYPVVAEVAEMATYNADGEVSGPGTTKSDSIPARLSDGEFVFSAEAVNVIGMDTLERMHDEAKAAAAAS